MKYFSNTISVPLAEKLKEKGMPIRYEQTDEGVRPVTTFGAALDWLMSEKDISICIYHEADWLIGWSITQYYKTIHRGEHYEQWHEAAEKAIDKALTLI